MAASDSTADREFVHSRLIDAPPERVFSAFADPARLARWWGPNGFSSTFETFEMRPGGLWRFTMHGPDGTNYPNESRFIEVEAPQRVVFEHLSQEHHFVMTISFEARGAQTLVGWRQVFDTAEQRDRIADFVSQANEQNLDRLAAEVGRIAKGAQPMPQVAKGSFSVEMKPQGEPIAADGVSLGRMSLAKRFEGDLAGTGNGEMLTALTATKGSAGYVAIERVTGTLHGRGGSFALQHSGTMNRGAQQLSITIVPDSGTGALAGIAGVFKLEIVDGKHLYTLEYSLPTT